LTANQLAILILVLAAARVLIHFFPRINLISDKFKRLTVEYMDSIIIAGVTALFIIQFLFRTFYIPSGSMIPTLQIRDYILVNEFIYRFKEPERGDIVVFKPPPEAGAGDKEYIKRIIGLPGDTLEVTDGVVYINGEALDEPYIAAPPDYYTGTIVIPEESLFVMGDNRPSSADSHIWGFLPRKNIIGKAIVIILPPQRIRVLK
jgi:signal peptidase I